MTLRKLPLYAAVGADFISAGFLTHSAPVLDLSMTLDL
jgi:nicotinate-nucleotide pyrophosphorylase